MSFVSHLSVLQNVFPEQSNPPTSQCVFTSLNIRVHRFTIQSLIGNLGRTCDCSADVFKSRNRRLNEREQWRARHKASCSKWQKKNEKNINWWIWPCGYVPLSLYVEAATRKVHKLQKPNILSLWLTDLRIPVSTFRNVYVNGADHVTESDLNCEIVTQIGSDDHGVVFARNPPRYSAI